MFKNESYQAKQFKLSGLHGISDRTLEMHFKLYEGYVKETKRLTEKIWDFLKDGHVDQEEMPAYSELTRRLGFEYNGMVLHEYYFENMTKAGSGDPGKESVSYKAAEAGFGSYDIWKADFVSIGKMRGVMNILYLIGILALGIVSVVILPIVVIVFFVGVAGLIARLGRWKMSRELSPRLKRLSLRGAT